MTKGPALTATALLVALPFSPEDTTGWDGLGWALATAAGAAVLALLVGAVTLHRGLRRADAEHPGWTVVAYVPLAILLAGVSGGIAALLAPAAAVGLVRLVVGRREAPATARHWGAPAA